MTSKLIFLVLPAIVFAKIKIELSGNVDPNVAKMIVNYSGSDIALISNTEEHTFQITENNLKYSALQQFGLTPDYAYFKNPSFWGDMYQINNCTPVTRKVTPFNAKILKVAAKPQIVVQQIFENNGSVPITYDVDISHLTEVAMSSKWTNNSKFTVNADIAYSIEMELLNSGGTMSMFFTSPWGADTEMRQTFNTGSASSVQVDVPPGETMTAQLHSLTATVSLQIEYIANLAGDVIAQYDALYKNRKFWELPVTKAMSIAGLPDHVTAKEVMHITCISHSKIVVSDKVESIKMTQVVV